MLIEFQNLSGDKYINRLKINLSGRLFHQYDCIGEATFSLRSLTCWNHHMDTMDIITMVICAKYFLTAIMVNHVLWPTYNFKIITRTMTRPDDANRNELILQRGQ